MKEVALRAMERNVALSVLLFILAGGATAKNMNGVPGQYKIANGNESTGVKFKTDYTAEFFEVYSPPIQTRYSEVFWAGLPKVALPDRILERFANKTMAVVGYEVDQVRRQPNGEDIPVPITHAYNHHYCAYLLNSKKVRLVETEASPEMVQSGLAHGSEDHWATELLEGTNDDDNCISEPMVQFFSEGNGGEFRLSYHGYPKGYAQLIYAPDYFRIAPMQIDTWNREEPGPKFKPGPLPRSSQIPETAGFSGLLECPCSDRIEKVWNMTYSLQQQQQHCKTPVQTEEECWVSAELVTQSSVFRHHPVEGGVSDKPLGCSLVQHGDGTTDVYWNPPHPSMPTTTMTRERVLDANVKKDKIAFSSGQVNITVAIQNKAKDAKDAVAITIVGPPDRWFGVGFGTGTMCLHGQSDQCPDGGPYAIIVQDNHVEERKLGYHAAGSVLEPTPGFQVHRNEIVSGNRVVFITRPRKGNLFSFDLSATSVDIIMARGCGMEFAQHCAHGPGQLNFLNQETSTQICRAGLEGTIQGRKFYEDRRCPDFPRSDLKRQHNPTCDIETYQGGLYCCNHGESLLDRDQAIPWPDQFLEYQLKFRFYFEEYQLAASPGKENNSLALRRPPEDARDEYQGPSHKNLVRLFWATEGSAGEYDIIQCTNKTVAPSSQCTHVITSRFQVRDMLHDCDTHKDASFCTGKGSTDRNQTKGIQLIYAAPHCHANSCLSVELYHANTGKLLCRVEPIYGKSSDRVYDEEGFLALPPCLWGDPEEGLAPPVLLPLEAELVSIKRNNSTLPHTGEMALWQMRAIVVPR